MKEALSQDSTDINHERDNSSTESNIEKHGQILLETLKTEDAIGTSNNDSSPNKAGHANYHIEQMSIVGNEIEGNNKQGGYMSEVMKYVSDIKKEESDEDVRINRDENNLNYKWLDVDWTKDVKCIITGDLSASEKGECVTGRAYSASEVTKYNIDFQEEKADPENVVVGIEGYRKAETTDSKDFKSAEITSKYSVDPSEIIQYQCNFCEYKAKTKQMLVQHFNNKHETKSEWYQCQLCEFRTKLKYSIRSHIRQRHHASAEWYQCRYCEFKTRNKFRLKDHFTCEHDISTEWYSCHLCEFKTDIKANFMKHFKENHTSSNEWHHCQLCEFRTRRKLDLRMHLQNKHSQNNVWHCTEDVKCMITGNVSLSEKCTHVTDNSERNCNCERREYSALEVTEYYSKEAKADLDNQVMGIGGHEGTRIVDSKGFKSAEITCIDSAGTHISHQQDASAEWYQCKFCEFKTKNKMILKDHFTICKQDTSAPWYHCRLCEFKTKIKASSAKHFKDNHTSSSEWYHCKHCEFITNHKSSFRMHAIGHFKHKHDTAVWYQCQFCEYTTKYKSYLNKHCERKHSGEWHQCHLCTYRGKLKCDLKSHMLRRHRIVSM